LVGANIVKILGMKYQYEYIWQNTLILSTSEYLWQI